MAPVKATRKDKENITQNIEKIPTKSFNMIISWSHPVFLMTDTVLLPANRAGIWNRFVAGVLPSGKYDP